MNILLIGSGAREHALARAFKASSQLSGLYCIGTTLNPGIQELCQDYQIGSITAVETITKKAKEWNITLAFIGPEAPLAAGVADALWQADIATIGPTQKLAQIETSKQFARNLMDQYAVPGLPRYQTCSTLASAQSFLEELGEDNYVIKANGLMGGKGVKIAGEQLHTLTEALEFCEIILRQNQPVVIEEKLIGQEFSFMCFADGQHLIPMPLVQDHKRAYVGDRGPNTGGMGSYSDANHSLPFLTAAEKDQAFAINQAIFQALSEACGEPYIGILYGSFMATQKGIYVIEWNARFGDPEALNVLPLLQSDFITLCQHMIQGNLTAEQVQFAPLASVCKYVVPQGYPLNPITQFSVDFSQIKPPTQLFLGSVHSVENQLLATGARTAALVGVASDISTAEKMVATEMSWIKGPLWHREDIGTPSLIQQRIEHMAQLRMACCA